ncbi:MAG: imidazole glycerol phosphate synthase subunit HisH [Polyangiaceae bacterium]|nr:imidazole glycerol phosphate synthase subunit HisH [Polyangiaceae bacterium]
MTEQIVLLDVGLGNLRSVHKALEAASRLGGVSIEVTRTRDPETVRRGDRIVVPGQGGFRDFARALAGPLAEALTEILRRGQPYFGICLGLQLLFTESDEAAGERGLGWLGGRVERLSGHDVKIPHLGWNQLELTSPAHPYLLAAGGEGAWAYFVHSFHAVADDAAMVAAHATHGDNHITAAISHENVFATQFHPEKSQSAGIALLAAFLQDRR